MEVKLMDTRNRQREDKTRLEQHRLERGMSQKELAEKSLVSAVAVSKYERRERSIDKAGIDILVLLSKTLGVAVWDILENKSLREAVKESYKRFGGDRV